MIPPPTDRRWQRLVTGWQKYPLESLAARMLITRLRLKTVRGDERSIVEAIDVAHDFFQRNEATMVADLRVIFGEHS